MRSNIEKSGDGTPSQYPFDAPCSPGCYPAKVGKAVQKSSRAGNATLELLLNIDGDQGPCAYRFWVQADGEMAWTFGCAVKALLTPGEVAAFARGEEVDLLADELVGLACRVQVGVEHVRDRDTGERTGETRPRVTALLPRAAAPTAENAAPAKAAPAAKAPAKATTAAKSEGASDDGF